MNKINLKSEFDNLELSVIVMEPKIKAKGIVQISHGMAEHKERYLPFMEYLQKEGYITIIHDHRGHGDSVKEESDLGYFYDDTGSAIVEDLHQITMYAKAKYPNLPVYLFGHSMGSMVVRVYLQKYDKDIAKLIVCGSPSRNYAAGFALSLVKFLAKIKGDRYRSHFINNLTFGDYNDNIKGAKSANAWICGAEDIVSAYDEDELCGFIFTLNGFLNLFHLMKNTYTKKEYLVHNKELPILFIAGADDPVIMSKEDFEEAHLFLKNLGYFNTEAKIYPGMRHELLNETQKETVYQDILNFLNM